MRAISTDNCRMIQRDLDRMPGWYREKKYDLNAGKCKNISFSRGSKPVMFQYIIVDGDLERFDLINDHGVLVDDRITFVVHIKSIVSKSARILELIKRISRDFNDPYTYKTLYVAIARLSTHQGLSAFTTII
jgi:hypothetical protein